LELGISAQGQKTRMMGLPGRERSLTVSSAVWIQYTNVTDGQTDGRTDIGRQQRPPLGIASRGKNYKIRFDSNSLLHDLCNSELVSCGCGWPQRYFSNKNMFYCCLFIVLSFAREISFFTFEHSCYIDQLRYCWFYTCRCAQYTCTL